MLEFFNSVIDFFTSLINFILNIVTSIVNFFAMLPTFINFISGAAGYLPTFCVAFFALSISILVVKLILDLV